MGNLYCGNCGASPFLDGAPEPYYAYGDSRSWAVFTREAYWTRIYVILACPLLFAAMMLVIFLVTGFVGFLAIAVVFLLVVPALYLLARSQVRDFQSRKGELLEPRKSP